MGNLNTTRLTAITLLLLSFMLASCSDEPQPYKKVSPYTTQTDRIDAFYDLYIHEKEICPAFVRAVAEDADLLAKLVNTDIRRTEGINSLLSNSKVANNQAVQYVIKNSRYFIVDVDYYGGTGYVYVRTAPIFCFQTDRRLRELEAVGVSDKAWEAREYYLNQMLTDTIDIGMPGYEGPAGFDFRALKEQFDAAKRTYSAPTYRQRLIGWTNRASTLLRERLKTLRTGESSMSREEQAAEVEKWIASLKKGL
jgi:hypothetical protein